MRSSAAWRTLLWAIAAAALAAGAAASGERSGIRAPSPPVQLGDAPGHGRLCNLRSDCLQLSRHPPRLCLLSAPRCGSGGRLAQIEMHAR